MFIDVMTLVDIRTPLIYEAPDEWGLAIQIGSIVSVPLRTRVVPALVVQVHTNRPTHATGFAIRKALRIEPFPEGKYYFTFAAELANYYAIDPLYSIKRIRQFIEEREERACPPRIIAGIAAQQHMPYVAYTDEQQYVIDQILPHIRNPLYLPTVIHGVTGSGKTEIYKKIIQECLENAKSVVLLLPEVTLAIQFYALLTQSLPYGERIRSFHSATPKQEKKTTWDMLINHEPIVIIGVHLPVLLPIHELGCIIVDEEHEIGYQEKKHPKINTKDAAIWRASIHKIPIILGSATPSISSLYNTHYRHWRYYTLTKRYQGSFPTIRTVLLTNKQKRRSFWISTELETAIADRLAKKEQCIIFLNRRGLSFFIQCTACGFVPSCSACSVSLTVHEENILQCHYCGHKMTQPTQCPSCKAASDTMVKHGLGTQQVVRVLSMIFPRARIGRADLDVTINKKTWQKTLADFSTGLIDILVGTQTITKGYHFPKVTLVGIIWADINLHFPIYNASETTLQQLIQVAGRAGRNSPESLVIVQAMAQHDIFAYLHEEDYITFYESELASRDQVGYPPCNRLLELECKHTVEETVEREAHALGAILRHTASEYIQILGPTKPPVAKIKHLHSRKIYLKGPNIFELLELVKKISRARYASSIHVVPNPLH